MVRPAELGEAGLGPTQQGPSSANWIATEAGKPFKLTYRVYMPDAAMTDPERIDQFLPPVAAI